VEPRRDFWPFGAVGQLLCRTIEPGGSPHRLDREEIGAFTRSVLDPSDRKSSTGNSPSRDGNAIGTRCSRNLIVPRQLDSVQNLFEKDCRFDSACIPQLAWQSAQIETIQNPLGRGKERLRAISGSRFLVGAIVKFVARFKKTGQRCTGIRSIRRFQRPPRVRGGR